MSLYMLLWIRASYQTARATRATFFPSVSDNSCLGLESIQVCRLRKKRPSTARKDPCSGYESSERAKFCCQRPRSIHKANRRSSGFRGCQVARGLARGSSNGSKQTWVVKSNWDRWQPVGISRIGVSGNRELSAHYTWKCRSTKRRKRLWRRAQGLSTRSYQASG
jgi:hypothetical protein